MFLFTGCARKNITLHGTKTTCDSMSIGSGFFCALRIRHIDIVIHHGGFNGF